MKKETYQQLQQTYSELPDFEKINQEFELSLIETEDFLLRTIKRKMAEKIEEVLNILETIINPDPNSFVQLYECRPFTTEDKKETLSIYRKLMESYRYLFETDILAEDKKEADAIINAFNVWLENKKEIVKHIQKLRHCWQKNIEAKEVLNYFG
ncbi:hypothetical protein COV18_00165 [Candidatus Woesearchaeota archaeon CG10_big_fil_rev_8_21_14_0_10_37_12]|nr:MAG: hypothetical protein COV18_00165 [Candidatus Woesearchaeota archaeon CG10_big_fil_rev_8_21_14_0_10_37_12]